LFTLRNIAAGQRVYKNADRIDSYNIIIKGKIGIFQPDAKLKSLQENITRVVCLTELEANKRKDKKERAIQLEKTKSSFKFQHMNTPSYTTQLQPN